ncbi:MAG: cysteine desulfurase NifS [Candidatus Coatesbacteria bacterium]|nr:cysteine desulfurase NifS [Candidatus Coatesbacteria bacterium]
MDFIYLDNNATTPLNPVVLESMLPFLKEDYGNASSVHELGRRARTALEKSRGQIADLFNAKPEEIIFTSCGTESDNYAILGTAYLPENRHKQIITSKIEHHAVLHTVEFLEKQGYPAVYLDVDENGIIKLDQLEKALEKETSLVSIMYANNEVGSLQPIEQIAKMCNEKGVKFHTDAVQAFAKHPVDMSKIPIDMLSLSAHKIYGPKGVGAMYIRKGVKLFRLMHGGHHEKNKRPGTENVAGIVGLATAARRLQNNHEEENKRLSLLRDKLQTALLNNIPDCYVNGMNAARLANTLNIRFDYVEGESILLHLDMEGICASSGSACTSDTLEPSHVLLAMCVPKERAHGSIRFSLGETNTEEQIDKVIDLMPTLIKKLRSMSPLGHKSNK